MKKLHTLSIIAFFSSFYCIGQNKDSASVTSPKPSPLTISGYVDAYYAYYSDSLGTGKYQKFPAISPRSNSFGINIFQLSEHYETDRLRSTATLHFGDLPDAAWSPVYNFIQEANVGFRVCKKVWIDGGFFKTHIGTEALLPKDNITSSVAMITFYEPWWQSGLKVSYNPSDKFQSALYIVNGYNEFVSTSRKKSLGLALTYALGTKGSIGYYNLVGDQSPDSVKTTHIRFLNNLVFSYQFCKKFKILLGFDYISQQHSDLADTTKSAYVYSSILVLNYKFSPKVGIYTRFETFSDVCGMLTGTIIDSSNYITGYISGGLTLGVEYKPTDNSFIRLEGRDLQMDPAEKIFYTNGSYTNSRIEVMLNAGIWF